MSRQGIPDYLVTMRAPGEMVDTYARKRRHTDPLAGIRVLDRARPFDEGDTTAEHIKTRACFERLADGTADNDDFDRVAMAINLAKVRALEIDDGLASVLECGQDANRAKRLHDAAIAARKQGGA